MSHISQQLTHCACVRAPAMRVILSNIMHQFWVVGFLSQFQTDWTEINSSNLIWGRDSNPIRWQPGKSRTCEICNPLVIPCVACCLRKLFKETQYSMCLLQHTWHWACIERNMIFYDHVKLWNRIWYTPVGLMFKKLNECVSLLSFNVLEVTCASLHNI